MKEPSAIPVRVLHVLGSLDRGGTETWLVELLHELATESCVKSEVLVQSLPRSTGYYSDLQELGVAIHVIPRNLAWPFNLYRFLKQQPTFHVVHSHRNEFGALVLLIALFAGIQTRIAHSHSDRTKGESAAHRMYRLLARLLLRFAATNQIAVSEEARHSLFGNDPTRSMIIYCGLDVEKYRYNPQDRDAVRTMLGLASSAPVMVHVGGFRAVKNHKFLIQVFAEYRRRYRSDAILLLVGDGPLIDDVRAQVVALGISNSVMFLGVRADVAAILSAADCFVFPSVYEGLGLAVVEAQVSGLPVVISDSLPNEVGVIEPLVRRMSLSLSPGDWVDAVHAAVEEPLDRLWDEAKLCRFDISENARILTDIYCRGE